MKIVQFPFKIWYGYEHYKCQMKYEADLRELHHRRYDLHPKLWEWSKYGIEDEHVESLCELIWLEKLAGLKRPKKGHR